MQKAQGSIGYSWSDAWGYLYDQEVVVDLSQLGLWTTLDENRSIVSKLNFIILSTLLTILGYPFREEMQVDKVLSSLPTWFKVKVIMIKTTHKIEDLKIYELVDDL